MDSKIKKLERTVDQQGYLLLIMMVLIILDTAGMLILWGERGKPDYDHIAVSLTVFQTMFGIAALYGFWALRGLTKEKAEEAAIQEVAKLAPSLVRREVQEIMQTFREEAPISDQDLAALVEAVGKEGKEGNNGQ